MPKNEYFSKSIFDLPLKLSFAKIFPAFDFFSNGLIFRQTGVIIPHPIMPNFR